LFPACAGRAFDELCESACGQQSWVLPKLERKPLLRLAAFCASAIKLKDGVSLTLSVLPDQAHKGKVRLRQAGGDLNDSSHRQNKEYINGRSSHH
jgi:hypothetical protein